MNSNKSSNNLYYFLFFLSGVSGLGYELLWARILSNIFGSSTVAHSIIIAIFMFGLAFGSYLAGKKLIKIDNKNLLRLYGIIELSIAASALISFHSLPFFQNQYVEFIDLSGSAQLTVNLLRFILIFTILITPTILMGATLPVISQIVAGETQNAGKKVGFLYSLNTFGAITGVAFAGFFSILHFGISVSFYIAAFINILIGLIFLLKSRNQKQSRTEHKSQKENYSHAPDENTTGKIGLLLLIYSLSGFSTMALEVVWIRALVFFVGSSTYAFSIILIAFLTGISVGSLLMSILINKIKRPVFTAALLEFAMGIATLFSAYMIYHYSTSIFYTDAASDPIFLSSLNSGIHQIFIVSFLVCLIPTLIMGALFPVISIIVLNKDVKTGAGVGNIYSANTLGTIAGSLAAGFVLIPLLGVTKSIFLICLIIFILSVCLLLLNSNTKKFSYYFGLSSLLVIVLFQILLPHSLRFKSDTETKTDKLLFYKEDETATVAVFEDSRGFRSMSINGMMIGGNQVKSLRKELMLAHLPMLIHENPKSVLMVGLGTGITLAEASLYNPEILECVEIVHAVKEGAELFKKDNINIVNKSSAKIYIEDGRNFLSTVKRNYDVIIDDSMLRRESAGNGPLYAAEYYKDIAIHLNKGGIFCQWLPLYLEKDVYKSILKTLKGNFKHVTLWYLGHAAVIQIASNEELKIDPLKIQKRLEQPEINNRLKLIELDDAYTLLKCFLLDDSKVAKFSANAIINSDDSPYVEFKVPLQNSSQFIFGQNLLEIAPLRIEKVPEIISKDNPISERLINTWNNFHLIIRGSILHHLEKENESLAAYINALTIDSTDKHAKYFLGIGRGELPSDKSNAYINIAEYYKKSENYNAALYYYKCATESKESVESLNGLALLYNETGNIFEAIKYGEKAVSLDPNNVSLIFNLATYYEDTKLFPRAAELYKKCIDINPLFTHAKDRLENIKNKVH